VPLAKEGHNTRVRGLRPQHQRRKKKIIRRNKFAASGQGTLNTFAVYSYFLITSTMK
jgi:hypothetical protein